MGLLQGRSSYPEKESRQLNRLFQDTFCHSQHLRIVRYAFESEQCLLSIALKKTMRKKEQNSEALVAKEDISKVRKTDCEPNESHSHLFRSQPQRIPSWVKAQLQLANQIQSQLSNLVLKRVRSTCFMPFLLNFLSEEGNRSGLALKASSSSPLDLTKLASHLSFDFQLCK